MIDDQGWRVEPGVPMQRQALCMLETIYFARPDSVMYGQSLHAARRRMGGELSREHPAPDADRNSVGEENFAWVVETAANYAIEKALAHVDNADNLTWGEYIKRSALKQALYP